MGKEEKAMTTGKIINILLLVVAIVGTGACGSDVGVSSQEALRFSATLTGANVVPPVSSGVEGIVSLSLNEEDNTIQFYLEAVFDPLGDTGKSITGAHKHIGAAGVRKLRGQIKAVR
jgi:hypothetical protein